MTNKIVNFSELGREEVRCIIYTDDNGTAKVERSLEGIKKLRDILDNPIIVYNIDPKTQIKLQAIVSKAGQGFYKDKKNIEISSKELMLDYLPLCTNIVLNLDAEIDKEEIQKIINDPKKEFELVIGEVGKIVYESSVAYADNMKAFSKLPKKEQARMIEEAKNVSEVIEETEEEKELREAEESVLALKEKIKQSKLDKEVFEVVDEKNKIEE